MNITASVKKGDWGKTKAMVSITFDDKFVVTGLKVVEGPKGLFVAMPSKKNKEGSEKPYSDIVFPKTAEFRQELIDLILKEYGEDKPQERPSAEGFVPVSDMDDSDQDLPF